jgi:hypothetical protein
MKYPIPYNGPKVWLAYVGVKDLAKHILDPNGLTHCENYYGHLHKGDKRPIPKQDIPNCHWCLQALLHEAA